MINLDNWQKEIKAHKGDMLICTGRRVGKTEILAEKAIDLMAEKPKTPIIIISLTEDQAQLILTMALNYAIEKYPKLIGKGRDKPTAKELTLNGGHMLIRAVGNKGDGARGFAGGVLIIDEASRMPKSFWMAATPTILTTNGNIWMASTPFGKQGYFWERYNEVINKGEDNGFKVFRINTQKVMEERAISSSWTIEQREGALKRLEKEKKSMSSLEFMQEYEGQFIDELLAFFPEELIKRCCTQRRSNEPYKKYLGVDIGGLGDDVSSFEIFRKESKERYVHEDSITTRRTYTTDTIKKIKELHEIYKFSKMGLDNAGLGAGIYHALLQEDKVKNKVIGLNNASKALDTDREGKKTKLMKEDMYMITRALMEQGKVDLLDDDEVINSLRSMQQEFVIGEDGKGRLRIFGNNSHIAEGIVRGLYLAAQDKTLNIWAA